MKKTSISSVVCFDIIDFAKKSEAEQQSIKKQFDALIALAVVDIPEKDRMIVDTGHGAVITCSGSLENALEDALFIALTVRDEILGSNAKNSQALYLLIGINLGSVKVENSVNANEAPKIIGEGLVEAQRIMSFAKPNQILVSRAYYDMASKLTLEIAQMFEKYDMHAYEHDIYAVRLLSEKAPVEDTVITPEVTAEAGEASVKEGGNWGLYVLPILLAIAMLFALTKWMQHEQDSAGELPTITMEPVDQELSPLPEPFNETDVGVEGEVAEGEKMQDSTEGQTSKAKTTSKVPPKKKTVKKQNVEKKAATEKSNAIAHESVVTEDAADSSEPSQNEADAEGNSFFKPGAEIECSQAQKAMNQCN